MTRDESAAMHQFASGLRDGPKAAGKIDFDVKDRFAVIRAIEAARDLGVVKIVGSKRDTKFATIYELTDLGWEALKNHE